MIWRDGVLAMVTAFMTAWVIKVWLQYKSV